MARSSVASNPMNPEKKLSRDRSIREEIKTLEGFPSMRDWSRDGNNRISTMSITLNNGCSVYYSYSLPIAFTSPVTLTLYLLDIPKDAAIRTRTTTKHQTILASYYPAVNRLDPEEFCALWKKLQAEFK